MSALSIEQKGNAMAAIDQLVRALAFPESGAASYRLAAIQLAVGAREAALLKVAAVRRERVVERREIVEAHGGVPSLPGTDERLSDEEIVDLVLDAIGRT